ncbi:MAG TPA: hypothetical protein VEX38_06790, partial [Fimbriimonadaceae bacterium]|nr:hypothetical protein [Fimbriimonadaceae bacterium]
MSETAFIQEPEHVALREYDLLREDCGLLELQDTGVLLLRGEDRKGWLQGQVTSDLRPLQVGLSSGYCFCAATGQLIASGELYSLEQRLVVLAPLETMPALLLRCEATIIMEDVQYSDSTSEFRRLSVQGPTATRRLGNLFELPKLDAGTVTLADADLMVLRSNRTGFGGWDILLPNDAHDALAAFQGEFERVGPAAFDVARLEAGVPVYGR